MKRSQRLQVIIDLHAEQERQALEELGRSLRQQQDAQAQYEGLQQHRLDYQQKLHVAQGGGMNVGQLLEFRAFIDKLDKAIDAQRQVVAGKEQALLQAQRIWEERHRKTQSLQKVGDAAVVAELKIEFKREQAEQDARAGRGGKKSGTPSA